MRVISLLTFLIWISQPWLGFFQFVLEPQISSPQEGSALQGVVTITGSTNVDGFDSAEISFSYDDETSANWFLIQRSTDPVESGALASWDTTTIADGVYRIRLSVHLKNGQTLETITSRLRVRNYSAVETSTPAPQSSVMPASTPTLPMVTRTPRATPSPAPTNPARITPQGLEISLIQGVLAGLAGFLALGIYLFIRHLSRH
jgi:hypothetical protein